MPETWLIGGIVLVSAVIQGSVGFGFGMFAAPLLAIVSAALVPGPLTLVGLGLTSLVLIREIASSGGRPGLGPVLPALLGRIPGTAAGAVLVATLPVRALGVTIAGAIALSVALGGRLRVARRSWWVDTVAGFFSGLMGTVTTAGGPPMAVAWRGTRAREFRARISLFFLVGTLMSIVGLVVVGHMTWRTVVEALPLLPFMVAGYALSSFLVPYLNDRKRMRLWISLCCYASSSVLLITSLT